MGKSWSSVVQEDKSVQVGESAQTVLGAGAEQTVAQQGSFVVDAPNTTLGDIIFNQFPEQVAATVGDLVGAVNKTVGLTSAAQLASTQALGQKLSDLQVGEAALLPKIILYLGVGGVILFIGLRMLKR
jgi:hypothetical protein